VPYVSETLESRLLFSTLQLQTTFGSAGEATIPFDLGPVLVHEAAGGSILSVGTKLSGAPVVSLAQFTAGGSLDTTFGSGGVDNTSVAGQSISAAVQSDGKIVVLVAQGNDIVVARFQSTGALDKTFSGDGKFDVLANSGALSDGVIAVDSTGNIVATGVWGNSNTPFLFRLTSDGHLDNTFDTDGKVNVGFAPYGLAIQSDNKIVIVGSAGKVARYTTTGALDSTFGTGGTVTEPGTGIVYDRVAIDTDGSMLVAGYGRNGLSKSYLLRLNNKGKLLTTFNIANDGTDTPEDLAIDPVTEQITVVTDHTIEQFASDGTVLDSGGTEQALFQPNGLVGSAVAIASNDDVLVGASTQNPSGPQLLRLNTTGRPAVALGNNGTLVITGTDSADTIGITLYKGDVRVRRNGKANLFLAADVLKLDIQGLGGNDVIDWSGTSIPGICDAGTGNDTVDCGAANDTVTAGAGKDFVDGGAGDDQLNGNGSPDQLYGGAGNDYLRGGDGDDVLDGGAGVDHLYGMAGNDSLVGGAGNDKLYADIGNDTLDGGKGADIVDGGDGTDSATIDPLDTRTSIENSISQ
jgi:uncharacterized delta-60 repeat protein